MDTIDNLNKGEKNSLPLISIIIPVYRVEKYLRRCLNSVVNQTYQNIEIILIDDGSPDSCGEICDEYARNDRRIIVIHQKNQGQAASRNKGVLRANGIFVTFVDSDDYVTLDYIELLFNLQREYDADIAIGNFYYVYEKDKKAPRKENNNTISLLNREEALKRMNYTKGFGATPWAKLYKVEIVRLHPFPEGIIYEDLATLYKIVADSSRVVLSNRRIYFWVQREGSVMHRPFDQSQMAGLEAVENQMEYIKNRYPSVIPSIKARYMGKICELMSIALNSDNSRKWFNELRKRMYYYPEVLRDPLVKKTQKIRLVAIKCGYYPAQVAFRAHGIIKKYAVRLQL